MYSPVPNSESSSFRDMLQNPRMNPFTGTNSGFILATTPGSAFASFKVCDSLSWSVQKSCQSDYSKIVGLAITILVQFKDMYCPIEVFQSIHYTLLMSYVCNVDISRIQYINQEDISQVQNTRALTTMHTTPSAMNAMKLSVAVLIDPVLATTVSFRLGS